MRENRELEFKQFATDSFLKTVSAYANYNGGRILFGVDDTGKATGLEDPADAALRIESRIHDSISPQPEYRIDISETTSVLTLTVMSGENKPYYCHSRAYKRNDSSTVQVDALELSRLILSGTNRTYDEIASKDQQLSFAVLQRWVSDKMGIAQINTDILKTLELCQADGTFNNAAALVSDKASFPGIDVAVFGESADIIRHRRTLSGVSVLTQYEQAMQLWEEYCTYEKIQGAVRETVQAVPQEAFREAVANALVHRTWDVPAHIRIAVYSDRLEVTSPGGLPVGIGEKEYLSGRIFLLRNPILGNLLYRLHIIERFGTGVTRIRACYRSLNVAPKFEVGDNFITVVLPFTDTAEILPEEMKKVYGVLRANLPMSNTQIAAASGFGKTKTRTLMKKLVDKGLVRTGGNARSKRYFL